MIRHWVRAKLLKKREMEAPKKKSMLRRAPKTPVAMCVVHCRRRCALLSQAWRTPSPSSPRHASTSMTMCCCVAWRVTGTSLCPILSLLTCQRYGTKDASLWLGLLGLLLLRYNPIPPPTLLASCFCWLQIIPVGIPVAGADEEPVGASTDEEHKTAVANLSDLASVNPLLAMRRVCCLSLLAVCCLCVGVCVGVRVGRFVWGCTPRDVGTLIPSTLVRARLPP